jgi:hypothetical protein
VHAEPNPLHAKLYRPQHYVSRCGRLFFLAARRNAGRLWQKPDHIASLELPLSARDNFVAGTRFGPLA